MSIKSKSKRSIKPVKSDMEMFKQFFHSGKKAFFQTFSKSERRKSQAESFVSSFTKARQRLVDANRGRMEIAMMINRNKGSTRRAENISEITALFVDCDDGNINKELLLDLPIAPHAIIETSPGNFHAYWKVKGCKVDQFKPLQKELARQLGSDESVSDPSRVMRIAGSINWKRDKPFLVKFVHLDEERKSISVDRFIKKMRLKIIADTDVVKVKDATNSKISGGSETASKELIGRIKIALDGLNSDDRWKWHTVGMAIHSADNSDVGYKLWTKWSQSSQKFDAKDQKKCWREFKASGGVNINTLFWIANQENSSHPWKLDEMNLAQLFAETTNENLRFDVENDRWLYFDGVSWKIGKQRATPQVRSFIRELCNGSKDDIAKAINGFRTNHGLRTIGNHAELIEQIQIEPKEFDKDGNLLTTRNGVVDLRTSNYRVTTAKDYLRRQVDADFVHGAKCPIWEKFVKEVTCNDRDLYLYLRRALGYTLFGNADLQVFFVLIGSGGNGKGVLLRTVKKILGDYAQTCPPNLLASAYRGDPNSPTPAIARLLDARMVVCSELLGDRPLDTAFIKQYAGGDELSARNGYKGIFSFKPEGKFWIATNEFPEISSEDDAMWRRLRPIPFRAKFKGKDVDTELETKLEAESAGILNWLIKGAKEFSEIGIGSCKAVESTDRKMKESADSVLAWLNAHCKIDPNSVSEAGVALSSYRAFARKARIRPLSAPKFVKNLRKKGYPNVSEARGHSYRGFKVIS